MHDKLNALDTKELDFPETTYIRDIESRVFQAIVLQCLAKIEGIGLLEGNLIDSLLSWDATGERIKGIHIEQDQKKHSVFIRVEVNISYGISIPDKANEIQQKIVEEITNLTGVHVACVHVIFKNLLVRDHLKELEKPEQQETEPALMAESTEGAEEYSDGL